MFASASTAYLSFPGGSLLVRKKEGYLDFVLLHITQLQIYSPSHHWSRESRLLEYRRSQRKYVWSIARNFSASFVRSQEVNYQLTDDNKRDSPREGDPEYTEVEHVQGRIAQSY